MMAVLVGENGLAQATGWSGNVGTMAGWFHKRERGRVMGAWANCFTVGALTSGWTMAAVLNNKAEGQPAPWRDCFFVGAAALGVAWLVFYLFQRNDPESAGLPPIADPDAGEAERVEATQPRSAGLGLSRSAWTNLLLVAGFYFFAKFIRYAVWSWAAYFLERNFGLTGARANVYATAFDLMGIPGIFLTGWISDRFFGSRRAGVATIMMIAMTVATALLMTLGSASVGVFAVLLGLVGFTLYGPDALLTSAGAIDIGNRRAATFTTAVISGFGSFGAIVQELVIARSYDASKGQLGPIMTMLFGSAAIATVFCVALVVRDRQGGRGL
jgi:sugar phosphate permease